MSFLKRILTCGWNDHDDTPIVGLPRFCLNKKSRFGGAGKPKVKSIQSTMQSIQAESLCNPCPETTNTKYHLPSLSFITCRHRQVNKVEELQLGSLVGIINNSREDESFLASDCFRVRIGKKHEISSLRSLRPKCLDSVLVFWNEIGC